MIDDPIHVRFGSALMEYPLEIRSFPGEDCSGKARIRPTREHCGGLKPKTSPNGPDFMTQRCLLILTYYFPPSSAVGSHRMLGFARHLPKYGWRSAVVAPPRLGWEPTDEGLLERVPPE